MPDDIRKIAVEGYYSTPPTNIFIEEGQVHNPKDKPKSLVVYVSVDHTSDQVWCVPSSRHQEGPYQTEIQWRNKAGQIKKAFIPPVIGGYHHPVQIDQSTHKGDILPKYLPILKRYKVT